MQYNKEVREILRKGKVKAVKPKALAPAMNYYAHFELEQEVAAQKQQQHARIQKSKLVIAGLISCTTMVAVANIPSEVMMSDAREFQNMQVQLNITPEISQNNEYIQTARFNKGDTLASVFKKMGLDDVVAENFIRNNTQAKQILLLPLGSKLIATMNERKQLLNLKTLIGRNNDRALWLIIERRADQKFIVRKEFAENQVQTQVSSGRIDDNFFATMAKNAIPSDIAKQLITIFNSTINFQHDIKNRDQFRLVFEKVMNNGEFVGYGRVLAAEIINRKGTHQALWYPEKQEYYTFEGDSLKRSFLQNPLSYLRMTSNFGMRRHPIKGYTHMHAGVDFGAPRGTPVFASSAARVQFVGMQRGYGRIVILEHGKGISTRYAHLSKFAKYRVGDAVNQGEVIGYVGNSGTSTAPHLHYEYRVNNVAQNPLNVLGDVVQAMNPEEKQQFNQFAQARLNQIDVLRQTNVKVASN